MPRAVKRFMMDADLEFGNLAVEVHSNELLTEQFMQFIFVSTRLRRWYPLHLRQMVRPRCLTARKASFQRRGYPYSRA